MAEDLTEYLHEHGVRVRYMHSDIDTLERIEILRDLRLGAFDVLVGINLLREGLDIPECGFVAILDADKEGFLRSETSLIQTIGRAARNVDGKVILYADQITGSMERAMAETNRRREKQMAWNEANGITPESVKSRIADILDSVYEKDHVRADISRVRRRAGAMIGNNLKTHLEALEKQMRDAAADLDFEQRRPPARRDQAAARDGARHLRRPAGPLCRDAKPGLRPREGQAQQGRASSAGRRGRRAFRKLRRDGRRGAVRSRSSLFAKPSTRRHGPGHRPCRTAGAVSRSLFKKQSHPRGARLRTSAIPGDGDQVAVPQEHARRNDRAPHREAG